LLWIFGSVNVLTDVRESVLAVAERLMCRARRGLWTRTCSGSRWSGRGSHAGDQWRAADVTRRHRSRAANKHFRTSTARDATAATTTRTTTTTVMTVMMRTLHCCCCWCCYDDLDCYRTSISGYCINCEHVGGKLFRSRNGGSEPQMSR